MRRFTFKLEFGYLDDAGKACGLSAAEIRAVRKMAQRPVSLQTRFLDDGDATLADFIPDVTAANPCEAAEGHLIHEDIQRILDTLSGREREVIDYRFGLNDGRCRTLEEVGRHLNVTRERVRQIEAKALRKLRHPSRANLLHAYLAKCA